MDALTTYRLFAANSERTLERISTTPQIAREVEYYKENIGNIKTAEELTEDTRLFNFVMRSYGLEEFNYAKAFMRKLLEGGPEGEDSLANRLTDPRYQEIAEDFNFADLEGATTSFDRVQQGVVDKYYQQTLELEAGNENNGARLAMYFERKAGDINTAFDILGDRALLQFVQTAYGLPPQMSFASLETQAEMITERLDIEDLQDPEFLEELTQQFLGAWDIANPTSVSVPPLISGTFGVQTLSLDLLSSLQNFKNRF